MKNNIVQTIGIDDIDSDVRIGRYFSRDKLTILLKFQEIWFSNADTFLDKNERKIPDGFFANFNEEAEMGYRRINDIFNNVVKAFVSCWTKFDEDNYALWKIYDKESCGVCIVTTVGKLKNEINKSRKDMIMCEVEYVNMEDRTKKLDRPWVIYDNDSVINNIRVSEKYKIKQYHYEEEIRSIIYDVENIDGFGVKVDLKKLIDDIYISPFSNDEEMAITKSMLLEMFDEKVLCYSKIDEI